MCGEHGLRNKGTPWEGSARIPFVIRHPGKIPAGSVIREALTTVDFKPTILSLMGVEGAGRSEGRDASALLASGKAPAGWPRVAVSRYRTWMMATDGRFKFTVAQGAQPKLFDLETDPFEMRDLFGDASARPVIRDLGRALAEYAELRKDPVADDPGVKADLAWAAGAEDAYTLPPRGGGKGKKRASAEPADE
jgi:arylsulfatase A-like enzyme